MKQEQKTCIYPDCSCPFDKPSPDSPCFRGLPLRYIDSKIEITTHKFKRGDYVRKRSGSHWQGYIVGEYSTNLTPEGYAVESDAHSGSVQIYPVAALELVNTIK